MDLSTFDLEMARLSSQWPNAYGEQRRKIFFNAFRDVANFDFRDAVTHCLATCKGAPLLPELTDAIIKAKTNYLYQKRIDEAKAKSALDWAYENNTTADPEFVDKCMKLVDDLYNKKITKKQFDEGCDLLDQAAKLYSKNKNVPQTPAKQISRPYPVETDEKPY